MASPQDFTPLAGLKAKQERIRNNQRRSRARRQEYLAELEQRLEQCRVTCRGADLLRQSFHELHAQNAHLRGLLNTAGIGPDLVESSLRQRSQQCSYNTDQNASNTTNLRRLKPKLNPLALPTNLAHPATWKSHYRSMSMSATHFIDQPGLPMEATGEISAEHPSTSTGTLTLDWLFDDLDTSWDNYAIQSNDHFMPEHDSFGRPAT
ncbi:hypothetical protein H2202_010838 [Exophiala xenobiotica]|nr:hypothetical protein H2202_010838 [Exophiala xenobiotica]